MSHLEKINELRKETEAEQRKRVAACEKFKETGILDETLFSGFDQTGKWNGQSPWWENAKDSLFLERIAPITLSPEQLFTTSPTGEITFVGVWIDNTTEPAEIPYDHILGGISINYSEHITGAKLKSVGGNCNLSHAKQICLPKLVKTHNLQGSAAKEVKLPELKETTGWLTLDTVHHLNLPLLETVGIWFDVRSCRTITTPELIHTGGFFNAQHATKIHAPKLEWVNGLLKTKNAQEFYNNQIQTRLPWEYNPKAKQRWIETQAKKVLKNSPEIEI